MAALGWLLNLGFAGSGVVPPPPPLGIYPGDTTWARSGVADITIARSGPGDTTVARAGPGGCTVARKVSS